jgi:predicted dehydrogenase
MEEFLRLLALGRVRLQPLITHQFALEDAARAYDTIMDASSGSLAVILNYPAAKAENPAAAFAPKHSVALEATAASRTKLGVALVGAGNLARWTHLPNLKSTPGVELRAMYSASGVRGKSYALRFGAQYCASDYADVLRDPDVKVVVIVSRNPDHAPQALAALRAGKNVFLEKPMALTEAECRELSQAVRQSGRQLTVGFNRRFAPTYRGLKKELARRSGPAVLNCRINSPGISGTYWMADPAIGGAILGEACHFVDLMYWLLGSEPIAVSAFSLPTGREAPIGENNLAATFRFADGSVGNLTYCTVGSHTSGGERVEAFAPGVGASAENFKKLTIQTSLLHNHSSWFAQKGYKEQMKSFFQALRDGQEPVVTVRDGARATLGCLRMLESARSFAVCEINLDALLE